MKVEQVVIPKRKRVCSSARQNALSGVHQDASPRGASQTPDTGGLGFESPHTHCDEIGRAQLKAESDARHISCNDIDCRK